MSCRSSKIGSLATTFVVREYQLTDSQATSLFHQLKRDCQDQATSDSDIDVAFREIEIAIASSPRYSSDSLRLRAEARLASARAEAQNASNELRFALAGINRKAHLAKAVIQAWSEEQISANNASFVELDAEKEFSRLMQEYKTAKSSNPEAVASLSPSSSVAYMPNDPATRYAVGVLRAAEQCLNCGQFIGALRHECPRQAAEETQESVLPRTARNIQQASPSEPVNPTRLEPTFDLKASEHEVSIEEFQEIYDSIRERINNSGSAEQFLTLPFDEPGAVTAGLSGNESGRSFGIELELDFPDENYPNFNNRYELASTLYSLGVTTSPYIERWHYVGDDRPGGGFVRSSGNWICEFDRSLDPFDGERGLEIKSQIAQDEPGLWRNVQTILDNARELGAIPTPRTGLHINLGAEDFSANNASRHNRLLKTAAAFDDTLVRLAHNPRSGMFHRGRQYCSYAAIPPEGFRNVSEARSRSNHYQAFNLGHLPAEGQRLRESARVEVRVWDGATTLGRVQNAVNVSLAFVELSKYSIEFTSPNQPAGWTREHFGTRRLENDEWTRATQSFRQFLGLYREIGFRSEQHQTALVGLFAESRWPKSW